jgi:hypothetical protein
MAIVDIFLSRRRTSLSTYRKTTYLSLISRLLQTNSFSGKMNALNDVNKLLPSLSSIHRPTFNRPEDNESLTSEKFIVNPSDNSSSSSHYAVCFSSNGLKRTKFLTFFFVTVSISLNTWKNWRNSFDSSSKNKLSAATTWPRSGTLPVANTKPLKRTFMNSLPN